MKMGCGPNFTDKSGFPYYFAKRESECVLVLRNECVPVHGKEPCLHEGKAWQNGKIKTVFIVCFPEGLCSRSSKFWLSYGLGKEWV